MISLKKLKKGESGKIQANYCNHKYKKGNLLGRAGKESFGTLNYRVGERKSSLNYRVGTRSRK